MIKVFWAPSMWNLLRDLDLASADPAVVSRAGCSPVKLETFPPNERLNSNGIWIEVLLEMKLICYFYKHRYRTLTNSSRSHLTKQEKKCDNEWEKHNFGYLKRVCTDELSPHFPTSTANADDWIPSRKKLLRKYSLTSHLNTAAHLKLEERKL